MKDHFYIASCVDKYKIEELAELLFDREVSD